MALDSNLNPNRPGGSGNTNQSGSNPSAPGSTQGPNDFPSSSGGGGNTQAPGQQSPGGGQAAPSGPSAADIAAAEQAAAAAAAAEAARQEALRNEGKRKEAEAKRREEALSKKKEASKATPAATTHAPQRPGRVFAKAGDEIQGTKVTEAPQVEINPVEINPGEVEVTPRPKPKGTTARVANKAPVLVADETGEIVEEISKETRQPLPPKEATTTKKASKPSGVEKPTKPSTKATKPKTAPVAKPPRPTEISEEAETDVDPTEGSFVGEKVDQQTIQEYLETRDYSRSREDIAREEEEAAEVIRSFVPDRSSAKQISPDPGSNANREAYKDEWAPIPDRPSDKREQSIKEKLSWLRRGFFKTSGEQEKAGEVMVLSKEVQDQMESTMRFFRLRHGEEHFLWESVSMYWGMSPDRMRKLFKEDQADAKVFDSAIIDAWKGMQRNVLEYGYPFVHLNNTKKFAGVYRFSIPILRNELTVALANGREGNKLTIDAHELQQFGITEWETRIKPTINLTANADQKEVLFDMVDAVEINNNTEENYSGRIPGSDITVNDAFDSIEDSVSIFSSDEALIEANKRSRDYTNKQAQDASRKGKYKPIIDDEGNFISMKEVNENATQWVLRRLIRVARSNALMNPVLGAAAIPEHILGDTTNKVAQAMMNIAYGTKSVTSATTQMATSEPVLAIINDMMGEMYSGNRAQLTTDLAAGNLLNSQIPERSFGEQTEGMGIGDKAKVAIDYGIDRYAALGHQIASGRFFMKEADAKRFIDALFFRMQRMEGSTITAKEFEQMMAADPVNFIKEMVARPEGQDALIFAMDNTVGGANVITEFLQRQMAKSTLLDLTVALFVSKFLIYGVNLAGKIFPFSHTFNYFVAKGIQRGTGNKTDAQQLSFGGNTEADKIFGHAFLQNLIIDIAWFGTRGGMLAFAYAVVSFLGVEPPDDEDKWYIYGEWKIAGVAIKENWMMRDFLGFVMPVVMAVKAHEAGRDPWPVFQSGAMNTMQGLPWLKMSSFADLMLNFESNLMQAEEDNEEQWGDEAPDQMTQMMIKAQTWGLTAIANFFEPPIMRMMYTEAGSLGPENLASSASMIYLDEEGNTTRTTYEDAQFRRAARAYPMVAHMLNAWNSIGASDQRVQTGYLKEQMPLIKMSDPAQAYWYDALEFPEGITEEDKLAKVSMIEQILREYSSPEEIAAQGIVIPFDARQAAVDYFTACQNQLWYEHDLKKATPGIWAANGRDYDTNSLERNQDWLATNEKVNEYKQLTDRLFDDRIPYSADKYNQWETTWRPQYFWRDSGELVQNPLDRWNPVLAGNIETRWYASGDHKSSIDPTVRVDNRYGTYDAQTPSSWFSKDLTDIEKLRGLYGNKEATSGMFKGQNLFDLMTGQGNVEAGEPTLTGQRALVPVKPDYSDKPKLQKGNRDDAWNPLGESGKYKQGDLTKASGSGGSSGSYSRGYSRSYSGGGSSKGYAPNIYSRPAYNLNADKPSTMYSKTPYESRFDYLRPGFETKGSREAYKRQDF